MESNIVAGIIGALSALTGSLIGGLFAMRIATRAHERQIELQQIQLRSQNELKARELMFGMYQKKMEESIRDIKELGSVLGKLGMTLQLPDINEKEKMEVRLAFIGTLSSITKPILERINEMESEFNELGIYDKYKKSFDFIRENIFKQNPERNFQEIEGNYEKTSKVITYLAELQSVLIESKAQELFSEYLPAKNRSHNSQLISNPN